MLACVTGIKIKKNPTDAVIFVNYHNSDSQSYW